MYRRPVRRRWGGSPPRSHTAKACRRTHVLPNIAWSINEPAILMSRYWSAVVHGLTPYVPGEQPKLANLVKLNTNENPYGPSPKVLDAVRAEAADTLRLYPDPNSDRLRAGIAKYHD